MLRKVLVAVDGSPGSTEAQRLAVALAQGHDARLAGIAVTDTPWTTRPMATGVGGSAYKLPMEMSELRRVSDAALSALHAAALLRARHRGGGAGCLDPGS